MIRRIFQLPSILLLSLILTFCSPKKLEISQASKLLNQVYPQQVIGKYKMMETRKGNRDITIPGHWEIAKLKNLGLVQYAVQRLGRDVHFNLNITKEGSELVHSKKSVKSRWGSFGTGKDLQLEVICGILTIQEINNIFQEPDSNEAEIEYTVTFEPTAFNDFATPYVEMRIKDTKYKGGQQILVKQKARKNSEGEWQLIPLKGYPRPN